MAWFATGTMAVVSAYSASESAKATNAAAGRAVDNANRRYEIQAGITQDQMEEQQQMAIEQMTDITRAFLVAKGKSKAIQAETMVTGASSQRMEAVERTKFSEAKGKVARDIDTNVVNLAQDMLAKKIDTEALVAEANASRKNVFTETAMGAIQGAAQGYSLGSSMGASSAGTGAKDTTKAMTDTKSVGYGFDSQTTFGGGGITPTNASAGWYTP